MKREMATKRHKKHKNDFYLAFELLRFLCLFVAVSLLRIHDSELVNPSAAVLGDIDIVLGIHSDAVRLVELAREASWPAEAR